MKAEEVRAIVVPKEEQDTEITPPLEEETSLEPEEKEEDELSESNGENVEEPFVVNPMMDNDPSKILGLAPSIQPEAVPGLVKLVKTYKLFGKKENVTNVVWSFGRLSR